jgi:hypothetical protein
MGFLTKRGRGIMIDPSVNPAFVSNRAALYFDTKGDFTPTVNHRQFAFESRPLLLSNGCLKRTYCARFHTFTNSSIS